MIPEKRAKQSRGTACPHTRGDDPGGGHDIYTNGKLVPIRVGMIPFLLYSGFVILACPHTRGDDPDISTSTDYDKDLSPYAWG